MNISWQETVNQYSNSLISRMKSIFPKELTNNDVHYLCIGTDRSCGDSLGPLVGTYLTQKGYRNVSGTIDEPVHAMNLIEVIKTLPKDKIIIAIDAGLGSMSSIGKIKVFKGSISPGAGVGKELPKVGDYAIEGIVNIAGFMEYFVLQNTRLSVVMNMANEIADSLTQVFPLKQQEEKMFANIKSKLWKRFILIKG